MAKNKKKALPRQHKIMNHSYLALVLMPLMGLFFEFLIAGVLQSVFPEAAEKYHLDAVGVVIAAVVCLLIFKGWFKGEFTGCLSFKNLKMGLLLLIPTLVFIIINLTEINYSSLTLKDILVAFFVSLAPGISEEVNFRGLSGSNYMRVHPDGRRLPLIATLIGLLFGASHLTNLSAGAAVDKTLLQVFYAAGVGVLYAAVFFRTGSLIPGIFSHWVVDFTSFMTPGGSGALTTADIIRGIVLGTVMAAFGYWYIRKSKREEIKKVWAEKWPAVSAECETPTASEDLPQAE